MASTVQIHIVLFSTDEDELAAARSQLERNYDIITQLYERRPVISVTMGRLESSIMCVLSTDIHATSHPDLWKLHFVVRFSRPAQARTGDGAC